MVDRIVELAKRKGVSISAIEKAVGLSNGIIGKWKKQSPSCDKLKLVADYLNVSIDYLLTGEESKSSNIISFMNANEETMMNLFRMLSEKEQDRIIGRLENMVEESQKFKNKEVI